MSSLPQCMSARIVDDWREAIGEDRFVLRARNQIASTEVLEDFIAHTPTDKDVRTTYLGYRPDSPVPIARYFCLVEVCEHTCGVYTTISPYVCRYRGRLNTDKRQEETTE